VRTQGKSGQISLAIAPRLLPDRSVAIVGADEKVLGTEDREPQIIGRDLTHGLAVMRVPAIDDSAVTIRQGAPRPGPRYAGIVEATSMGPAIRPVYIGRMESFEDPGTGAPLLSLASLQHALPRGAAVFSLEGTFIGLVRDSGDTAVVIPAESLRLTAQDAQSATPQAVGDLGIEIDTLTGPLSRATGVSQGVIVVLVRPGGPAEGVLQPGDVIQSIDGSAVTNIAAFREIERNRAPSAEVVIAGVRSRAPLKVSLRAANASGLSPAPSTSSAANETALGLVGRTVAGAGIEVIAVTPGGAAARAGLERGDLILTVDGARAPGASDLARRFRSADPAAAFLLTVQRGAQHRVLALEKR
jgi:serine protease Do